MAGMTRMINYLLYPDHPWQCIVYSWL